MLIVFVHILFIWFFLIILNGTASNREVFDRFEVESMFECFNPSGFLTFFKLTFSQPATTAQSRTFTVPVATISRTFSQPASTAESRTFSQPATTATRKEPGKPDRHQDQLGEEPYNLLVGQAEEPSVEQLKELAEEQPEKLVEELFEELFEDQGPDEEQPEQLQEEHAEELFD
ncbi:unnamed protein product [Caenorhabditis nigoni]